MAETNKREVVKRTPLEKRRIIQQIQKLKKTDGLSVRDAAEKLGIPWGNYYSWVKKKSKSKTKKYTRRTKTEPVLVTSLVPVENASLVDSPSFNTGNNRSKMNPYQIAELLAVMNAKALSTLISGDRS